MQTSYLSYQSTGKFSDMMVDYLAGDEKLRPFYHRFPEPKAFADQLVEKSKSYRNREVLVNALSRQHKNHPGGATMIERLKSPDCYTVTTGHQLCLFTGPLYFVYKIVSTIKLAEKLRNQIPEKDIIPVFWMATEDHDFDEVNHLYLHHKKVFWESGQGGAVGRMNLTAIHEAIEAVSDLVSDTPHGEEVIQMLKNCYASEEMTLAEATRNLVYALFGEGEVLVVDGDDPELKSLFVPAMQRELMENFSSEAIDQTNSKLQEHYPLQVTQREINLFYLDDQLRERIVRRGEKFEVLHTGKSFTSEEILKELKAHPENFSPNVVLRPLYQEIILPNLCYIGGGGELAYWFQLKEMFESAEIPFPVLLLRNSVMWASRSETRKMERLNLSLPDLFQPKNQLIRDIVHEKSEHELSLESEAEKIRLLFREVADRAAKSDPTFEKMVLADGARVVKMLRRIEKRMMRAEKERHGLTIDRINHIFDQLFPGGGLQERHHNFFEFYARYGKLFLQTLMDELDPLRLEFTVIEER